MARKVITRNLKTLAGLKYLNKDGNKLCDKEDIIMLCARFTDVLNTEVKAKHKQNQNNESQNDSTSNQNQNRSNNISDKR